MDFSTLSYRELQGHAKQHGIPANKKKDELIRLLTEATNTGSTEPNQEEHEVENIDLASLDKMINEEEDVVAVDDNEEEDNVDDAEVDAVDELCGCLDDMKLKGIPTPEGKKIVFEEATSEDEQEVYRCNWGWVLRMVKSSHS